MAGNVLTYQILEDGPRNHVVKVVGILDTADILLSATPITCGITISSPTVTQATTTSIVVGQRVTGTGIPANTYIIANINLGIKFCIISNFRVFADVCKCSNIYFFPNRCSLINIAWLLNSCF